MIISVLVENTSPRADLGCEHALSLYIATKEHRLLFDTGASGLFAQNAHKLGIDLADVDTVILSHGHYDHGGGFKTFLAINKKAALYLREGAFDRRVARESGGELRDIGLDRALLPNARFTFTPQSFTINDELELFSDVQSKRYSPIGNDALLNLVDETPVPDCFSHEQNLVIREENKLILTSGCAHRGIVNILERFRQRYGRMPDHVVGGFHLYRTPEGTAGKRLLQEIAAYLLETGARFHTCHCTGTAQYEVLKSAMGHRIGYLSTGDRLEL